MKVTKLMFWCDMTKVKLFLALVFFWYNSHTPFVAATRGNLGATHPYRSSTVFGCLPRGYEIEINAYLRAE